MPKVLRVSCFLTLLGWAALPGVAAGVHVWEKQELTFTAARSFANPYTEVTVWVDLAGPDFKKRVYGFWDGGQTFRVRVVATAPGNWTWRSGSTPADQGLAGKSGSFDGRAPGPRTRSSRIRCARVSARDRQSACPGARRWHAVLRHRRHLVCRRHQSLQVVRRRPGASDRARRPASRITCGTERRRATTGSTSSPRFPNWMTDGAALARGDERSGANHRPLGLARVRDGQREEHGQRRRPAIRFPGQGPGLRKHVSRRGPGEPRLLPLHRPQDRLFERTGVRALHRSLAAGCQPLLEEVLPVAGFLRAVHPVHLVAIPGQQHGAQPDPPGHHQPVGSRRTISRLRSRW